MTDKTRDLPLLDFLTQLQLEYIVAELRSKIYQREKDKSFWKERVMVGKKRKIMDIHERNPEAITIFTSEAEMQRLKDRVYNAWGLPNFYFKDSEQREELEIKDLLNYFSYNKEFLIRVDEYETKRGVLKAVLQDGKKVTWAKYREIEPSKIQYAEVKLKGEDKLTTIHLSNVVRIL